MAVIRISGLVGAGKSTLARGMADSLGYEFRETGEIFNAIAREKGLSKDVFYERLDSDPDFEREIDRAQEDLMMTYDNLIVNGRMAPWLKCGFKAVNIKLAVDLAEGAKRIKDRPENSGLAVEEIVRISKRRMATEREHYRKLYCIDDHLADDQFQIIIDTTDLDASGTLKEALEKFRSLIS